LQEPQLHAKLSPHPNICRYMSAWKESFSPILRQAVCNGSLMVDSESDSYLGSSPSSPGQIPDQVLMIQMELFDMNLQEYLRERNVVDHDESLRIFHDILAGVGHLHRMENTIFHRDIKPSNIFLKMQRSHVDKVVKAVIGDFGLSTDIPLLSEGVGTYTYAAPEQKDGSMTYNEKADVYSLGIILFELFSSGWTTECERKMELRRVREDGTPTCFKQKYPNIDRLVERAVSKLPERRPSVEEMFDYFSNEIAQHDKMGIVDHKKDRLSLLREVRVLKSLLAEKKASRNGPSPKQC